MKLSRKPIRAGAAFVLALASAAAAAQDYPRKLVRLVQPFPPGGALDVMARAFAQKYSQAWGQPVIVENRPGAGGIIASELIAKSAPDGHTLLFSTGGQAITPGLFKKLPYDAVKDFAPVTLIMAGYLQLVTNPAVPATSVRELVALAKAWPGKLNYGSTGFGIGTHLAVELLRVSTGIDIVHVPFKGDAAAVAALVANEVQIGFLPGLAVGSHVRSGRLRVLAMSGSKRSATMPDVPTMVEAGVTDFEYAGWIGLFAPAGTPQGVLNKISGETAKILKAPDMVRHLSAWGYDPVGSTPAEFSARYRSDMDKYRRLIRAAKIPLVE